MQRGSKTTTTSTDAPGDRSLDELAAETATALVKALEQSDVPLDVAVVWADCFVSMLAEVGVDTAAFLAALDDALVPIERDGRARSLVCALRKKRTSA